MAAKRTRSTTPTLFRPNFVQLEDRAVPASLFVDNAFAGLGNGTTATFNAGQSNQQAGVVIGTNGFSTIEEAITKANSDAAADEVNLANGTFNVDPTATAGPLFVTNPLSLVGSGKTVSTIKAISDTVATSGTNGGVIVAQNTTLNVSGITFEGNSGGGIDLGTAFRFETSSGTVLGSTFQNVANGGVNGLAVLATGTGSVVTVDTSGFSGNGIGNVRFDLGATGTVKNSTFVGRNTAGAVNYGVEVSDGGVNALITGNFFSNFGNLGYGATNSPSSAAVAVYDDTGSNPSSATIIGNNFNNNDTSIFIGVNQTTDNSFATINYNNFLNESFTVFVQATTTSDATNNFWNNTTGPNNDATTGNISSTGVTFSDAKITQPPNGIIQATLPVVVATSAADYVAQVAPTVTITGQPVGTSSPVTLTVLFSKPVTGFTASDIVLSGAVGTPVINSVTDLGNGKFSVVVGGLNKRGALNVSIAQGVATDATGLGNQAGSNAVAFQPPFDIGFGVSADSGIVTPTFGVPETLSPTRFGTSVFGSSFTGGVRTATADVNGDGTLDYIVASGPGRQTEVRVIDGATEATLFTVIPFGTTFTRGAYVSAGDLTGDGLADIVITAERGGGARVRIFRGATTPAGFTQLSDFIGIIGSNGVADTGFRGGARSAVGDFNGDGRADLAFAAGTGGGPRIALFDGNGLGANGGPKLTGDFFVFEPTLRDGSNIAAGDVDGDGKADLIAGAGNGAARVRVLSGATIIASKGATITPAIADYFAFGTQGRTGVRVAARDLDLDGKADVIAGPGSGAGSSVRIYSAVNLLANPGTPAITNTVSLFGSFTGGVFVG
ncbi:hypothetical protein BH11PLA2_BH11PLA2_39310 [soil metagenome]